jgi:hypothetical protein
LVVESGGCYHYGVKLTFTLPLSPRTARPLLEEAAELMSKARLKDRLVADVIPRLRKRSKEPYVNGEPIHDTEHEMETIYVSEELGKNARRVIVTYSNTL